MLGICKSYKPFYKIRARMRACPPKTRKLLQQAGESEHSNSDFLSSLTLTPFNIYMLGICKSYKPFYKIRARVRACPPKTRKLRQQAGESEDSNSDLLSSLNHAFSQKSDDRAEMHFIQRFGVWARGVITIPSLWILPGIHLH